MMSSFRGGSYITAYETSSAAQWMGHCKQNMKLTRYGRFRGSGRAGVGSALKLRFNVYQI